MDHVAREREKVLAECPEHLEAFESAVSDQSEPVEPTPTPTPVPTTAPLTDAEEKFLNAYRAKSLEFSTPDRAVIDAGKLTCAALKNGRPEGDIRHDFRWNYGLSERQADGMIYAASPERCRALWAEGSG
jgi:hypothetical protein